MVRLCTLKPLQILFSHFKHIVFSCHGCLICSFLELVGITKHLMTGHIGNSEVAVKQNSLFPCCYYYYYYYYYCYYYYYYYYYRVCFHMFISKEQGLPAERLYNQHTAFLDQLCLTPLEATARILPFVACRSGRFSGFQLVNS